MTNVLVCIKRVPDLGAEVTLSADSMGIDDRSLGHTVSAHEECAVELAIQTANATGGAATVLTVGPDDATEQLRNALAVGCTAAVIVQADAAAYGPVDVAAAIADVVAAHEADGTTYDVIALGNDASDTGDFQVGIRLSYLLDCPVVAGVQTFEVDGAVVRARAGAPDGGTEIYEVATPVVLTVLEGGVEPRYPSIPGRMKAKKVQIEERAPEASRELVGSGRIKLKLPPTQPSQVEILGEGPEAAAKVVDLLERLGVTA
jgi:electron transfer flavoprotein beta subunit